MSCSPDYEASLKKEGGIPEGPVLESLLAGETLDKKVETKEEEPMSECQVRRQISFPVLFTFYLGPSVSFHLSVSPSVCVCACAPLSLSLSLGVCALALASRRSDNSLLAPCMCVCVW